MKLPPVKTVPFSIAQTYCNEQSMAFAAENPIIPQALVLGALLWRAHQLKDHQMAVDLESFKAESIWDNLQSYWEHKPAATYWNRRPQSNAEKWNLHLKTRFGNRVATALEARRPSKKVFTRPTRATLVTKVVNKLPWISDIRETPRMLNITAMADLIEAEQHSVAARERACKLVRKEASAEMKSPKAVKAREATLRKYQAVGLMAGPGM